MPRSFILRGQGKKNAIIGVAERVNIHDRKGSHMLATGELVQRVSSNVGSEFTLLGDLRDRSIRL